MPGSSSDRPAMVGILDPLRWAGRAPPPMRWRIPGLVPDGAVTMLSGDGAAGKTTLLQQFVTAAAAGRPTIGLHVEPCKALLIACEDEADELHRRQVAMNASMGVDMADLENLLIVSRVGQPNELLRRNKFGKAEGSSQFYGEILSLVRSFGAQLIGLDGLHDLFDGNENSRPEARQFVNLIRKIALENDGAVILNAHPSLQGLNSGSGTAGSTAWNNAVRSRLYLHRPKGEEDDATARELTTKKANYAQSGGSIKLRWSDGVFVAETPAGGVVGAIERGILEKLFVAELAKALADGLEPSIRVEAREQYCPKLLQGRPPLRSHSVADLERTMRSLLGGGEIVMGETDAPPSRRKKIIVPKGHPRAAHSAPTDTPTNTTDRGAK